MIRPRVPVGGLDGLKEHKMGHFDYLLKDDERTFFQGVAEAQAISEMPKVASRVALRTVKTAAPTPQNSFEKLASRIDQDIKIIKMAGLRGRGLGTCERAERYLSKLAYDQGLSAQQYAVVFMKVAVAALDSDFEEIRAHSRLEAPPELYAEFDAELGKIASETLEMLMDECSFVTGISKEAGIPQIAAKLLGGGTARRAATKALAPTVGKGLVSKIPGAATAKAIGGEIGAGARSLKGAATTVKRQGQGALSGSLGEVRQWRLGSAQRRVDKTLARQNQRARAYKAAIKDIPKDPTTGGIVATGKAAKYRSQLEKGSIKLKKQKATLRAREAARQESITPKNVTRAGNKPAATAKAEAAQAAKRSDAGDVVRRKQPGDSNVVGETGDRSLVGETSKKLQRKPASASSGGPNEINTSSPSAAQNTMNTAKNEGWWSSLSDTEKKQISMAAAGGFLASKALD